MPWSVNFLRCGYPCRRQAAVSAGAAGGGLALPPMGSDLRPAARLAFRCSAACFGNSLAGLAARGPARAGRAGVGSICARRSAHQFTAANLALPGAAARRAGRAGRRRARQQRAQKRRAVDDTGSDRNARSVDLRPGNRYLTAAAHHSWRRCRYSPCQAAAVGVPALALWAFGWTSWWGKVTRPAARSSRTPAGSRGDIAGSKTATPKP
jgi:hypothetical protein